MLCFSHYLIVGVLYIINKYLKPIFQILRNAILCDTRHNVQV